MKTLINKSRTDCKEGVRKVIVGARNNGFSSWFWNK